MCLVNEEKEPTSSLFPLPSKTPLPSSILMSQIGDSIQTKCLAFGDRVIKLNDYLLRQACKREDIRSKKEKSSRIPIHLLAVANISNQLLRAGTSIAANNAEATNAISKADFKSKSFIALKEARECLYWLELLHSK